LLRKVFFLICLFLFCFTLCGCGVLSKWRSYYYTGEFQIEEAYVCSDVTEELTPINISNRFEYGIEKVCLLFKYRYSDGGTALLRIRWYYEGVFVFQNSYYLESGEGKRAFYFFLSSGKPLPKGIYEIRMMFKGKVIKSLLFEITGGGS